MKKSIFITVIYTAIVVAFDMASSYVFANAELAHLMKCHAYYLCGCFLVGLPLY